MKLGGESFTQPYVKSPPIRGCGLKRTTDGKKFHDIKSPPIRGCGLKRLEILEFVHVLAVTPHTGVWIETCCTVKIL